MVRYETGSMIKWFLTALFIFSFSAADCQVKLYTVNSLNTDDWNYNQRKIIRCPETGIIAESSNELYYSEDLLAPVKIKEGKHASLAVDYNGTVHLVYEDEGIQLSTRINKSTWTPANLISEEGETASFPVADCDKQGNVHIIYGISDSSGVEGTCVSGLKYVQVSGNEIELSSVIYPVDTIDHPIAVVHYDIATHLAYTTETIYITFQLSNDSIYFLHSVDSGVSWQNCQAFPGLSPSLSIGLGYYHPDIIEYAEFPSILYEDQEGNLLNNLYWAIDYFGATFKILDGPVEYACIDDVIGPFGYSFIFSRNGVLYHAFNNGFGECIILDTVSENALVASIAYKQFNPDKVDIIWYEKNGAVYNLYYNYYEKIPTAVEDPELDPGGFHLAASPNPFNAGITFAVTAQGSGEKPVIRVYGTNGKLLKTLSIRNHLNRSEIYWDGTMDNGNPVTDGIYIVNVEYGSKSLLRKIIRTER
ncbi:MAG: T9SS type A sorting domain-containing protein [Bacteroidales bacterium]|nr:T9SS type A sorting domain-containing protein [Bacteroidales bacterium]MBN2699656.1 T9SS type A sorting domain-containing protein [Bacteroidales bacterium]